jgi:3-hydroxyisobutyrate dehydrogenase
MSRVGFIGLGTMGRPMARNLLKAGHEVTFFSRRPDAASAVEAAGGRPAASPALAAEDCEFVVTIVTADQEVREVVLGPGGIIETARPGKLLIEMSTISPETVRDVAARLSAVGMGMIDAPVSGGPWGAQAASLTVMIGGEAGDVERARPVLEAMGRRLFHVGPRGAGQTVKLVNQMVAGGIMALVAEGFVLAHRAGANLDMLADVMAVSSGNSAMLEARGKKFILADHFEPGFKTSLMAKDVRLALEMAGRCGVVLPVSTAAMELYRQALEAGFGDRDFAAIIKLFEDWSGFDPKTH